MTDGEALIDAARRQLLGGADAEALYANWFHAAIAEEFEWPLPAAYGAAVCDPSRFTGGWIVESTEPGFPGVVRVRREAHVRAIGALAYLPSRARRLTADVGDALSAEPLAFGYSGGFWHLASAQWQEAPPALLDRVYFSLRGEHATAMAQTIVRCAPPEGNWAAKLLSGRHGRGRRDAALLYLPRGEPVAAGWPATIVECASRWCTAPGIPFGLPLARGIATVPDPGDGASYGQALCRSLAQLGGYAGDQANFAVKARAAIGELGGTLA